MLTADLLLGPGLNPHMIGHLGTEARSWQMEVQLYGGIVDLHLITWLKVELLEWLHLRDNLDMMIELCVTVHYQETTLTPSMLQHGLMEGTVQQ